MLFPLLVKVLREDGQDHPRHLRAQRRGPAGREGMEQNKGWFALPGETPRRAPTEDITENGIVYTVDFENGRKPASSWTRSTTAGPWPAGEGHTVLDCFTHTGSFALNAARAARPVSPPWTSAPIAVDGPRGTPAQRAGRRYGLRVRQRVRPAAPAGEAAAEIRLHHPGPAGLYQEPQDRANAMPGTRRSTTGP